MKKTLVLVICLSFLSSIVAQEIYSPESLTIEDYQQAEQSLGYMTNELIFNDRVSPIWIDGDRFIYVNNSPEGREYVLIDGKKSKKQRLFDQEKLATQLSELADVSQDPMNLNLRNLKVDGAKMIFTINKKSFSWNLKDETIAVEADSKIKTVPNSFLAPDGKRAAFIRNHNLWVQDLTDGSEIQLTQDGMQDFGYATNNAGWTKRDGPVLLWSPDSKKIATFQHDGRGVGEMYMVSTKVGHPELQAWKYPLPGDSLIFRIHRVVIDVEKEELVRLQMPPDMHRSTVTDHIALRGGKFADVEWSDDGNSLAFVSSSRDHKEATLRVADSQSGKVRDVIYERVETFFESGYRTSNWRYLPSSNEAIWYSQKSNWGHLYLHDLNTGKLKNPITSGDWNVTQVLKLDKTKREIYFYGCGKEAGDPYYQYL